MTLVDAAVRLREATRPLTVPLEGAPIALNPLLYAWEPHEAYLSRYGGLGAKTVWVGMNPGPWGMAQTGVPFGAVPRVKGFLGISGTVEQPALVHPKRPIQGFDCPRVEVSGDRLWGTVEEVCGTPERFFAAHFVVNYCPLLWQSKTGANVTPDKLPQEAMAPLYAACDVHLAEVLRILRPEMVIGVGVWAEKKARAVIGGTDLDIAVGRILHPSPASPAANRGWKAAAIRQLEDLGHPLPLG